MFWAFLRDGFVYILGFCSPGIAIYALSLCTPKQVAHVWGVDNMLPNMMLAYYITPGRGVLADIDTYVSLARAAVSGSGAELLRCSYQDDYLLSQNKYLNSHYLDSMLLFRPIYNCTHI